MPPPEEAPLLGSPVAVRGPLAGVGILPPPPPPPVTAVGRPTLIVLQSDMALKQHSEQGEKGKWRGRQRKNKKGDPVGLCEHNHLSPSIFFFRRHDRSLSAEHAQTKCDERERPRQTKR
mmetsp:Transcript_29929/g.58735  ORF Transcript_29929/g.58735 Transcript_29929/m.58735 type:complete len:119 (-) Transcript_29929:841-1197(-)